MPPWRWPAVLTHRCGGRLAPENSLAGLCRAAALGIRGVEFDAMLAACGTPVVIHDETLDRTTEASGPVAGRSWAELAQVRLRDAEGRLSAEHLPSLEQIFRCCARLGLAANVEIKPSAGQDIETGREVARQVARLCRIHPVPVLLSSFSSTALDAARTSAPSLSRGHLFAQLPIDACERATALGCQALIVDKDVVDAAAIDVARRAGLSVGVYTENHPGHALQLRRLGVAGVITDRPDTLGPLLVP
ncbi:glycerophosphodiester phosphodiesterase [Nitrogeniibacter mangrovi]|uniref:Glycerophosphodiester phosphodiesterase n=1 Tax=Nitrogeniibacter mangrovi TaxID=2016596 RepID=A0A6C1B8Y8_9RHOO|nr:glycerophosphodiester phosphodiesterase family protein [Nitrogeniibacter mangrovi]QID18704.1 glycerophosphodiester phosphodiesterase [Nitrogeniibacter mangrovi]